MTEYKISENGKKARFAQWDAIGVDFIKADLFTGGHRFVGGPPAVRALAREWVRMREAEQAERVAAASAKPPKELVTLKPTLWGLSLDLKEVWRRARQWRKGRQTRAE